MFWNWGGADNRIDQKTAKEMMDAGDVVVVDVRTPGEYASGRIENAVLLPLDTIGYDAGGKLPDKDKKILVYCLSGSRSRTAAAILTRAGYKNVYDFGGIGSWPYGIVR